MSAATPDSARRVSVRPDSARRLDAARPYLRHAGLPVAMALSAVLGIHRLAQNGYANIFYSAGVKSMLRSLHNFLFVSFDPGGLVTVDKPPLALWVQAISAKVFGFSPLSLLLPEAIAGVLAVALLYVILARRVGALAAFAGALALAVFPSFVAVSRDNGVDPVLILLLVLACGLALRACETGRWRTLIGSAVVVGLAFNTKTLAAYLVVPGIALAFLVCAPGSLWRRLAQLAVAGLALVAVSFAWIALVEVTPASKRPYVGSSTNNTEIGLTFEYNGLGRVEGQTGGPNSVTVRPGAYVPAAREQRVDAAARAHPSKPPPASPSIALDPAPVPAPAPAATGREKDPIPFGEAPKVLRLFGKGLGDQAGWMLPFALFGLLGVLALVLVDRMPREGRPPRRGADAAARSDGPPAPASWRRDPRLALALVLGGWFVVEAAVLSLSKGIVHPYYVSALAPGTGAMAGAGAVAFVKLARERRWRWRILGLALAASALATTLMVQVVLMHREHYMVSFVPVLVAASALAFLALAAIRRLAVPAMALIFVLLLIVPGAYATTTWLAPVEGTFPVAGPKAFAGTGGYGVDAHDLGIDRALLDYVATHRPGSRWALLTVAADTGSPMILMGLDTGALGGYSGTDPAVDGPQLAGMVARREARYVLLGGEYSLRGGNLATKAVLAACKELPPTQWNSPVAYPYGLVLFDCAGDEKRLAAAG
ncbi:MAG TPA: glycosyltransferase family 39 protein [Solirubrobacteraceae bacterium]|nr:glycosyltransferase family 39 protein [Solirubrobacteraceae bacterium]